jgi:putative transposase
MSVREIEGHIR